jgi:hypothetical protein
VSHYCLGDFAPYPVPARWAAIVQIVLDLAFFGLAVRVFAGAAMRSVKNKTAAQGEAQEQFFCGRTCNSGEYHYCFPNFT